MASTRLGRQCKPVLNSFKLYRLQPSCIVSPFRKVTVPQATCNRQFSASGVLAASRYPDRKQIEEIFKHMETGNFQETFKHVAPDVDWTVMGTHPLADHYKSLQDFQEGTLKRLRAIMKEPGFRLKVRNVAGGGDQEWAVVELIAEAECKNGLDFDNTYAWVMRFNEEGKVVQVRAYLDSALVQQAIVENECPSNRAPTS